jgi:hypothetical protein
MYSRRTRSARLWLLPRPGNRTINFLHMTLDEALRQRSRRGASRPARRDTVRTLHSRMRDSPYLTLEASTARATHRLLPTAYFKRLASLPTKYAVLPTCPGWWVIGCRQHGRTMLRSSALCSSARQVRLAIGDRLGIVDPKYACSLPCPPVYTAPDVPPVCTGASH